MTEWYLWMQLDFLPRRLSNSYHEAFSPSLMGKKVLDLCINVVKQFLVHAMFHEIERHWPHTSLHTCTKTVHNIIPNIVNTPMAISTRKETGSTILQLQVGDAKKVFKSNIEAHDTKPQQSWGQEEVYLPDSSLPMSFILRSTRIATRNQCLPLTPPCSHPPAAASEILLQKIEKQ